MLSGGVPSGIFTEGFPLIIGVGAFSMGCPECNRHALRSTPKGVKGVRGSGEGGKG